MLQWLVLQPGKKLVYRCTVGSCLKCQPPLMWIMLPSFIIFLLLSMAIVEAAPLTVAVAVLPPVEVVRVATVFVAADFVALSMAIVEQALLTAAVAAVVAAVEVCTADLAGARSTMMSMAKIATAHTI